MIINRRKTAIDAPFGEHFQALKRYGYDDMWCERCCSHLKSWTGGEEPKRMPASGPEVVSCAYRDSSHAFDKESLRIVCVKWDDSWSIPFEPETICDLQYCLSL